MDSMWLGFGQAELAVEKQQLEDEGAVLPEPLDAEMNSLLTYTGLQDDAYRKRVRLFLEQSTNLPRRDNYAFDEPSELAGIHLSRPGATPTIKELKLTDEALLDRLYGAWLGRCCGCLLGKPIEGLMVSDTWPALRKLNKFPLDSYLDTGVKHALEKTCSFTHQNGWIDQIDHMIEDDDTNYTVLSLAVLSKYRWDFTPVDIATFWLENLPVYHTFSAERVAYRNLLMLKYPPASAFYCNPYREWIGAQIRGDFWGYVCPGDPSRAADLAWRDACVSHVKNGIYGEMWSAAMVSAAVVVDTPRQILESGLAQVPMKSRLNACINEVIHWYESGISVEEAIARIHQRWDEMNPHHWCHVLSNGQIVTIALLWGGGDFENSIGWAATAGFDTDCNAATVGSILGMQLGADRLPSKWVNPLNDRLDTGIKGYEQVLLTDLARRTLELAREISD